MQLERDVGKMAETETSEGWNDRRQPGAGVLGIAGGNNNVGLDQVVHRDFFRPVAARADLKDAAFLFTPDTVSECPHSGCHGANRRYFAASPVTNGDAG